MTKLIFTSLYCLLMACSSPTNRSNVKTPKDSITTDPKDHLFLGKENARKQLDDMRKGKGQPFTWDTLIKSTSTAIAIAEPLLFDIFGKEMILQEKPYEIYLLDGYWYIAGTIPKGSKGGGFEMIFSARDGKIIRLTHYK